MTTPPTLRDRVELALTQQLSDSLDCTRVWSAWGYGTMGQDDFEPVCERLDDIVDAVMAAIEAQERSLDR